MTTEAATTQFPSEITTTEGEKTSATLKPQVATEASTIVVQSTETEIITTTAELEQPKLTTGELTTVKYLFSP